MLLFLPIAIAALLARTPAAAGPVASRGPVAPQPQQTSAPAAAGAASSPRALLDKYCVTCHNERLRTASLTLDRVDTSRVGESAELWEKVLRKLNTGAMPPAGAPRPDAAAAGAFVTWLDGELARAAAAHPHPGRPALHRLNRAEYGNAVRDLLAVEIDSRSLLPADDSGYGFDNIADVLSVSPGLLERYMNAARRISRMAIGDPGMRPAIQTYSAPKYLVQDDRVDERLPFGSRGGIAIPHFFPLDGQYTLKVRLQRTWRDEIRGLGKRHSLDVRLDRARIQSFTIGGDGARTTWLPGQAVPNPTAYELNADAGLEVRFAATAGQHVVGLTFQKQTVEDEGFLRPNLPVTSFEFAGNREIDPAIDTVQIGGPYDAAGAGDTASRRQIFVCRPGAELSETACARQILRGLARRAYRRPVTEIEVDSLMTFYKKGRAQAVSMRASSSRCGASWSAPSSCSASSRMLRGLRRQRRTGSVTSSWHRGFRFFSGAAFPTTPCLTPRNRGC